MDFNEIAKICYDFYDKNILVKSKPTNSEWTNLAAILATLDSKNFRVLSIATGSKCLSEKQLPLDGSFVHDSHAEILARRCFLRYVYNEMHQVTKSENYQSGDASIIPKSSGEKRRLKEDTNSVKRIKTEDDEEDIHRTGAKCVPNGLIQDTKEKGVSYHTTGVVRTKPGRGDPTISMSCSDKIAKWLILGIQGSLLSNLLAKPIYLSAIVIGKCPFSNECIERALINRSKAFTCKNSDYKLTIPVIGQSNLYFKESKLVKLPEYADSEVNSDLKACPNSVCWSYGLIDKPLFVLVKGFLQGASVKNLKKNSNFPPICKYYFYSRFEQIFSKLNSESSIRKCYSEAKQIACEYNEAKEEFFKIYSDWIRTNQEKYYKFVLKYIKTF
ncbi:tRNA-specific adenosine deaminase 1 [Brachionus plicatilis]|uniref:tRNA-specific adenosine deaminase 1 n=1 Tax=Brachionus plicatilis TaxID=10195 RepID=A0A3M7QBG2_BRAPC|nr:tRNA-specific adenosine deaminase 1 [Brachionus plicatilis]